MQRLSFIALLVVFSTNLFSQSPHGSGLTIDCAQCHNPSGWELDLETMSFDHNETNFDLEGAHLQTDCKSCHNNLIFDRAPNDCFSCHVDVHQQSVGNDCMRCHTSDSWLVFEIPELHEQNGFPLIGAHSNLSCVECHTTESSLVFNRMGNECIECHRSEYLATQNPNHVAAGFSQDCTECHSPLGFGWDAENIIHDFFPLTMGHDIQDCSACHTGGNFSDTPTDCFACHMDDYASTSNPNHQAAGFSTDCVQCHTTNPGWMPATFDHDELFFPIYSGRHDDVWTNCTDCHTNPNNYSIFTCLNCHPAGQTAEEHDGVSGYMYESNACLACHPNGEG
ncbi:MAG: hypothetical protein HKO54_03535 [Flavobacteriaceae bacterium]|nr:hypothetical protein [Flavobacteriaceae bacterium]